MVDTAPGRPTADRTAAGRPRAGEAGCPVGAHGAVAACPWGRTEAAVRRLLWIRDGRGAVSEESVHRIFNVSILLSALRCLLSYVVFPILGPAFGAASGVGPALGIPIALVALVFDVLGIRRFWRAGHRLRWLMTGVYLAVMGLVCALLVGDVSHLAS